MKFPANLVPFFIAFVILILISGFVRMRILAKRRREAMASFAAKHGLEYQPSWDFNEFIWANLPLFDRGHGQTLRNLLRKSGSDREEFAFDFRFTQGSGKHKTTYSQTVALFRVPAMKLPEFTLEPEHLLHRIAGVFGYQDIDIASDPEFSKLFLLRGKSEAAVRALFSPSRCRELTKTGEIRLEGNGEAFAVYRLKKEVKVENLSSFLEEARRLFDRFR